MLCQSHYDAERLTGVLVGEESRPVDADPSDGGRDPQTLAISPLQGLSCAVLYPPSAPTWLIQVRHADYPYPL